VYHIEPIAAATTIATERRLSYQSKAPGSESWRSYLVDEYVDHVVAKDVADRDPGQEAMQSLERGVEQRGFLGLHQDELTQLVDDGELLGERVLELLDLGLSHLAGREVEHLLAQEFEDHHVVLAQALVGTTGIRDLTDKSIPVSWPLLLDDLVLHARMHECTNPSARRPV